MSNKPPEEIRQDQNQIRHNLVSTAVNFLLNPSVSYKPIEHKTAFLRKKGLTEAEIAIAYERASNETKYKQIQSSHLMVNPGVMPPPVPVYRTPDSFLSRLSRYSSSVIVLGVAVFGAHYIYKNYIEPLIFGEARDDKSRDLEKLINSLSQLQTKISDLEEMVKGQKEQIDKVNEYYPTSLALRELKNEVASVKSLMLNRHQFPALPKVTSPSIPQWQLPSKENDCESNEAKQSDDESQNQNLDEIISAAKLSSDGSSEDSDSIELINGKANENSKMDSDKSESLNDSLPVA